MPDPNPIVPAEYLSIGRVWIFRKGVQLSYDGAVTSQSSMYSGRSAALTFRTTPMSDPQAVGDAWTSGIANPVNQWIEVDFGLVREVDELVLVPLMYRNGARNPQTLDIQCSDDGQLWYSLGRHSGLDWINGQPKRFAIGPAPLNVAPMVRSPGRQS